MRTFRTTIVLFAAFAMLGAVACTSADPARSRSMADAAQAASDTSDDDPPTAPRPTATANDLEVHYLDVGQADATLLLHDEVAVLLDAGHWQRSDIVEHLHDRGVDALDLVIVTHPHADHLGQFAQVLDGLPVDEVWWSGSLTTTATFSRSLDALERSDARYEEPRTGDVAQLGPLLVEVVNPPVGTDLDDLHDAGLSVRITFGDLRFLFTGDAEATTEQRMIDEGPSVAADVLKLGHHGSSTSTTPSFLAAVDPAVAIYSAEAGNTYGHPHREVMERLDAAGVDTYGTDVHGSLTIVTDGQTFTISTDVGRPDEPLDLSTVAARGANDDG